MKLLFASDIHGSAKWCRALMDAIGREAPDTVVLLGDLLYHGPRNDLPEGYAPKEVIPLLNSLAERIVAVRGNCEAEVDQMVLDFPCMADYAVLFDGERRIFCTHGHLFSPDALPPLPAGSAFVSGHTHVRLNEERNGIRLFNPGSVGLPKDGAPSYGIYEAGVFCARTLRC